MKIINKIKKNEYFLIKNFLFLATIFIVIIALSGVILSYSFIKTSDEKIMENANNNLAYVSNTSEKKILELSELVRYIALNKNMNYALYNKGTEESSKKDFEVVDALKLMILNANAVESVYIYNKNINYLTTSDGTVPIKSFDDMEWLDLYNNLGKNEVGIFFRKIKNSNIYKMTLICRAIKNEYNDSGVIMNVNISRLLDFEKENVISFMYDKNEKEILYNSGYIDSKNDYTDFLSSESGIMKIDDSWYSMAKSESANGKFEYIVLEKAEDYLSSKLFMCIRILIVLVVMMLIFTFIAFAVANSAYETIRIIREISENPNTTKYNKYLENDVNTKKIADTVFRVVSNNEKLYTQLSTTMKNYSVAQLKALQWQINPHFIFNTLNTLYCISDKDAGSDSDIANGILILSELMRYSLKTEPAIVTFYEEMKVTENYINLMRLRFKNKFNVEWHVERKFYDCKITKLCLQPVLENCFSYAVKKSKEKTLIKIQACEKNGVFQILISDNGKGMDEERFEKIQSEFMKDADKSEMHIGLTNVHNRIRLMYGMQYGITLINNVGEGFTVVLKFPI